MDVEASYHFEHPKNGFHQGFGNNCFSPHSQPSLFTLASATCPEDPRRFGLCTNLLNNLLNGVVVGTPSESLCCTFVLENLGDLEASVCICNAIKSNVLGINLNVPVVLSLLVNFCGKDVPSGYQCM
ncbi:hypothetical protein OSB04_009829 [Centaurea solstitialis]|uniref:Hydrophobic seed protein domain-containing protein n=1 Tax=Centaurea solstitialis TaxID=347529 RepID=A0AA38WK23_9ASTR|nr:hypothetical protein OSB04_009829 [Centaurea solstitialis]